MKALYDFIIEPVGERYNNKKNIEGNELILNTELHNHNYSNRVGKVIVNWFNYYFFTKKNGILFF